MPVRKKRRPFIKKSSFFPKINKNNHSVESDADENYNCIAYAADVTTVKWWPVAPPDAAWPLDPPYSDSADSFIRAFRTKGYEVCNGGAYEEGLEKIAFFEVMGHVKHAARQVARDKWASKLGDEEDIHHKLDAVAGGDYGEVTVYMSRKKAP